MSNALDQTEGLSKNQPARPEVEQLTPAEIVAELDKFIISQDEAKKSVAIALRNRWRRLQVPEEFRDEITPKNIIMIGPTGVGKTEISRRLAKLAKAPFIKVEASKFTEVGYVGRDVESIIRDLVDSAYNMVREEERKRVLTRAEAEAEERLLDLLLPGFDGDGAGRANDDHQTHYYRSSSVFLQDEGGIGIAQPVKGNKFEVKTRERFRELLRAGKLEERVVEFEVVKHGSAQLQVLGPQGFGEIEGQIKDMFSNMIPKQKELRKLPVSEARRVLTQEAQEQLIDQEQVVQIALKRAEQTGIVFIDEIDKICGREGNKGPDVSREGVQRDLLPIVEGCSVNTKFGPIKTDHILFIASGAFHIARPSDLMPEFQGRFPIRVELKSLTPEHFIRILTEPQNSLTKQYIELLKTEGVTLEFGQDAIAEIAKLTAEVNSHAEDIGARRLHTLLEKLLEDLLFSAQEFKGQTVNVDRQMVQGKLSDIVKDTDLSRFIL